VGYVLNVALQAMFLPYSAHSLSMVLLPFVRTPSVLDCLDEWIRRPLRMCLLKQWKKPGTKRRNFGALGIPENRARLISGSHKGYWRLTNTPQVNKALGLVYWCNQGLISLGERYRELRCA